MARFNNFLYGFIPGLFIPIVFLWVYLNKFYPNDLSFIQIIKELYPSILLGKLLLLSVMPNLALVFVFYKSDSFKLATGIMVSAMPYFIASVMML
jgi:hypothetical protein